MAMTAAATSKQPTSIRRIADMVVLLEEVTTDSAYTEHRALSRIFRWLATRMRRTVGEAASFASADGRSCQLRLRSLRLCRICRACRAVVLTGGIASSLPTDPLITAGRSGR